MSSRWRRLERSAAIAIGGLALVWCAIEVLAIARVWDAARSQIGSDYAIYRDATARWLAGGSFYLPSQLTGPYPVVPPVVLYPPPALLLFAPFQVLPAVLWWAIPIGLTTWVLARHRPRPIAIAVILLCVANPTTHSAILWGNPAIWIVAGLALGTIFGWPSVFVFLKPTLLPFALIGAWRRSWWAAMAVGSVVSLLFVPLWLDYATALSYAVHPSGLGYSLAQLPMLLIPVAAWLGRSDRRTSMPAVIRQHSVAETSIGTMEGDVAA